VKRWWTKRAMFSLNRPTLRSVFIFLLLSGLTFVPWRITISTPAILESSKQIPIHLKEAAQISELRAKNHQYVEAGAVLLVASQPSLEHDIESTARRMRLLELQLRRYANSRDDLSNKLVTEQKLGEMQSRLSALMARRAELTLRAPAAGYLQLSRPISVGQWVQPSEQLFFIFDKQRPQIVAFISEGQMHRISRDSAATFIANDGIHETLRAHIATIEETAIESVTYYEMTSEHGGPIAVRQDTSDGALRPEEAYYKTLAHPIVQSDSVNHNIIGELHIETAAYAPFNALWNGIAALLVRESGF
jgi:putative peptide zinc metalloprotease protein